MQEQRGYKKNLGTLAHIAGASLLTAYGIANVFFISDQYDFYKNAKNEAFVPQGATHIIFSPKKAKQDFALENMMRAGFLGLLELSTAGFLAKQSCNRLRGREWK